MAPPLRGFTSDPFPSPVGLGSILCEHKKNFLRRYHSATLPPPPPPPSAAADVELKETDILWSDADVDGSVELQGSFFTNKAMAMAEDMVRFVKHKSSSLSDSARKPYSTVQDELSMALGMPASSSPPLPLPLSPPPPPPPSSSSSCGHGYAAVVQYRTASACRTIPQRSRRVMEEEEEEHFHHPLQQQQQHRGRHIQSAPVQVPLWTKFMMEKAKDKMNVINGMMNGSADLDHDQDTDADEDEDDDEGFSYTGIDGDGEKGKKDDQEEEDDDGERLPPHELLAREYARSQRTTFSVCEGLGRTLKGRDLSCVRNAVWSRMGFAD